MQEVKDIEKVVEEILERRPDLILKALRNFIPGDVATKDDLKMMMELIEKRFEAVDKRFDAMDKRFDDLIHYTDRKYDILVKTIFSFNIPILIGIIAILVKTFM